MTMPLRASRPSREYDGEGTGTRLAAEPFTIFADPRVHDGQLTIVVDIEEDTQVGDFIEIPHNHAIRKA